MDRHSPHGACLTDISLSRQTKGQDGADSTRHIISTALERQTLDTLTPRCLMALRMEQAALCWCPATSLGRKGKGGRPEAICLLRRGGRLTARGPALSTGQSLLLLFSPKLCFIGTERCCNLPKGTQQVWVGLCKVTWIYEVSTPLVV